VSGPGISGDVGRDHLDRDDDDIRPFSEAVGRRAPDAPSSATGSGWGW
jgi:hypothetical protein